jgi:hypothetical protein
MFGIKKSKEIPIDVFNAEVRAAMDKARDAGCSNYSIQSAMKAFVAAAEYQEAVSKPWSGHIPVTCDPVTFKPRPQP